VFGDLDLPLNASLSFLLRYTLWTPSVVKSKLHIYDLLWICCTTDPQQIHNKSYKWSLGFILRVKLSGAVYCYRSCLFPMGGRRAFVGVWMCVLVGLLPR